MKEYFRFIILIFLTFSFFSCEKKSLDEQLYKEVMSIKKVPSQKKIEKLVKMGADINYNNMIVDIVMWNDIPDGMFGIVIGGGTYFGHEYARIVALTEYDIYRYLNDKNMRESFKKALIMTDKDKEDFESSFWTVASTWRRDYDEGDSGYWFTEDGYMGVCNDMYEIKTELIRLENAFTNELYRERAENYIGDIMLGLLGQEEES